MSNMLRLIIPYGGHISKTHGTINVELKRNIRCALELESITSISAHNEIR